MPPRAKRTKTATLVVDPDDQHRPRTKICPHCEGSGFVDWIGNAFNKVKNEFVNPDSSFRREYVPVIGEVAKFGVDSAAKLLGALRGKGGTGLRYDKHGKVRAKRVVSDKVRARNKIVLEYKNKHKLSLIQASKEVKDKGLWPPK